MPGGALLDLLPELSILHHSTEIAETARRMWNPDNGSLWNQVGEGTISLPADSENGPNNRRGRKLPAQEVAGTVPQGLQWRQSVATDLILAFREVRPKDRTAQPHLVNDPLRPGKIRTARDFDSVRLYAVVRDLRVKVEGTFGRPRRAGVQANGEATSAYPVRALKKEGARHNSFTRISPDPGAHVGAGDKLCTKLIDYVLK